MAKLTLAIFLVGAVARVAHADAKLDEAKQHLEVATQLCDENKFGSWRASRRLPWGGVTHDDPAGCAR